MYINARPYITHKLFTDIHESHYLRFARLYSLIIIRMLTNHTFALTTPSWNIKLPDKDYQIHWNLSIKIRHFSHKLKIHLTPDLYHDSVAVIDFMLYNLCRESAILPMLRFKAAIKIIHLYLLWSSFFVTLVTKK